MQPEKSIGESVTGGPVTSGRTLKPIPQLDGLRGLAVLMVFCNHAFKIPGLWAGVDLFFILSGYLITSILLRDVTRMSFGKLLKQFYLRRAERILPPYLMMLALAYFTVDVNWRQIWWCYAFFLQNLPPGLFNNAPLQLVPMWSLAVEQHFYLFWPVMVFFVPKTWLKRVTLGLLFFTPVLRGVVTLFSASDSAVNALTPFRMDAIAAGALTALVIAEMDKGAVIRWAKVAIAVGAVLMVGFLRFDHRFHRTANAVEFNVLVYSFNILMMGGLFLWTLLSDGLLVRVMKWEPLRWMGRISYMFYLLHVFVLEWLTPHMSVWKTALLGFALSAAGATASWYWIEKPILSLSASHRRKVAAAVA